MGATTLGKLWLLSQCSSRHWTVHGVCGMHSTPHHQPMRCFRPQRMLRAVEDFFKKILSLATRVPLQVYYKSRRYK